MMGRIFELGIMGPESQLPVRLSYRRLRLLDQVFKNGSPNPIPMVISRAPEPRRTLPSEA
jgi:hypothetical protein